MIAARGEESPQTVSVMNNLALLLENQGLYDEAEPLFKKAFAISGKIQELYPAAAFCATTATVLSLSL